MIVPDVNILVYAHSPGMPQHLLAVEWWERTLSGHRTVGLAWAAMVGFIRVTTNLRAFQEAATPDAAIRQVERWLAAPCVRILSPGDRHASILFHLIRHVGVAGNLSTDAHLAALAIEYQAELVSNDRDFGRFPGLRWFNPLS